MAVKKYSQEIVDFISTNCDGKQYIELAEMTNAKFGTEFTFSKMKSFIGNHHLKTGLAKNKPFVKYSQEILDFITDNCYGRGYKELIEMTNAKFGTEFTFSKMKSFIGNHHLNTGSTGQFVKGHIPANKGKKQEEYMTPEQIERSKKTRFRSDDRSINNSNWNHKPIGSERFGKNKYILIKVAEPNKWVLKHRYIYEKVYGQIPKNHDVIFADGNRYNFDISNLVLISKAELLIVNNNELYYPGDAEATKSGVVVAKLLKKVSEIKNAKK